jgi:hypothetical protein
MATTDVDVVWQEAVWQEAEVAMEKTVLTPPLKVCHSDAPPTVTHPFLKILSPHPHPLAHESINQFIES